MRNTVVSIIIPTFNEAENIESVLKHIHTSSHNHVIETLVVDGGSTDDTVRKARQLGAEVVHAPEKGRAKQMNLGADQAKGEVLYFLHADTIPPPTFIEDINLKMDQGDNCGCFLLSFNDSHPALRAYAWFTRFDVNFFRFGDQSLFVRKELFDQVNGFNEELKVMEDQEIIKRLKKHAQFGIIKKPVITSARKYRRFGVFKLQFIFTIIVLLFYLGVPQEVIAHFYRRSCTGNTY